MGTFTAASPQNYASSGAYGYCEDNGGGPPSYVTTSTADVTENYGDHGWVDYGGDLCSAGQNGNSELSSRHEESDRVSVGGKADYFSTGSLWRIPHGRQNRDCHC